MELCAANLYPDPKQYLGFTMCLTRDYEQIPEKDLVEDCALEHGIDFERLNACASADDGSVGMRMLRESVLRSIEVSFLLDMLGVAVLIDLGQGYKELYSTG